MRHINKLIFLILFVLILSTPSQAATPVVSISASVSPNVIEAGGSGVLTVRVSETGGGDWIKNPTVGILSYPDGLTFSGTVKTIPKIGKSSSDIFSFNFNTRESISGTGQIIVRLEYYEMDAFNVDTYGPYYKDSSTTFNIIPSTGSITVTSTPTGATIYLDGSYKEATPATLSNVPVGSHTIKFTKSGYNDISKTVMVSSGNTATISGTLIQETGSIIVSSDPSGANVYLDGIYKGTSPLTIDGVALGDHKIKLTRNGYTDETISIIVKTGTYEKVSKTLKLVPIAATPSVKVDTAPKSETQNAPKSASTSTPSDTSTVNNNTIYGIIILLFTVGAIVTKSRKRAKKSTYSSRNKSSEETSSVKKSDIEDSWKLPTVEPEPVQQDPVVAPASVQSSTIPVITSAFGYKGATIQYKIKVENSTSEPIADIKINLYVPDVFLTSESTKSIAMLKPSESKTVTFEIRPTGECGDCEVSGKVVYYDYSSKKTTEVEIPAKSLSIVCPMLKGKEISKPEWHGVISNLVKAEESTKDLDMPARTLFEMTSRIVKDINMHQLEPEMTDSPQLFNGVARFYGEGVKGLKYAAQVEVVGGAKRSRLILKTWAEKEEALTGFYHGLLDQIEKRVHVKGYIDDSIVQNFYHYGDKIGTQVKDSIVQRSNIGAGGDVDATEKKCSECGTVAEGNGRFFNGCGGKL